MEDDMGAHPGDPSVTDAPSANEGRARGKARADVEDLARRADRVTSLLLYSDLPEIDIEIAINELRELCRLHFPGRMELFRMVYESRWRRFREQGWGGKRCQEPFAGTALRVLRTNGS